MRLCVLLLNFIKQTLRAYSHQKRTSFPSRFVRARAFTPEGLFTPKTHVFSAADILLRIYQNPMHLNGTRWRTTFWRQREVRRRKTR